MPREEIELIGPYDYTDNGEVVHLFSIGYIESKSLDPGFYIDFGDTISGPFSLPSVALEAALNTYGRGNELQV